MDNILTIKNFLINYIFPTSCMICGIGGKTICEKCFLEIPINPKDNLNILSIYEYKNKIVNKLLWKLKYQHSGDVADIFATKISVEVKSWLKDFPDNIEIIFIPTPLNNSDKRLHNHAELLAKAISKNFLNSKVVVNLLEKNSSKKQAHTKNKHERLHNLEKKIYISGKYLNERENLKREFENKLIIIVDDVTTTGATICNVRNILSEFLEIPEERILGVTVAH